MPYGGKRKRVPRKAQVRRRRSTFAKAVATIAKKTLMRTAETKVADYGTENIQLYHNTWICLDANMMYLFQGVEDDGQNVNVPNRIGDMVQAQKLWMKLQMFNKQDRPNLHYRVVVVRRNTTANNGVNSIPSGQFALKNYPNNGNQLFADITEENCTVLYDRTHTLNNQQSRVGGLAEQGSEISKLININYKVPARNQKVYYDDDTPTPKKWCYQLWIVPYDAYGTLTSDNIASVAHSRRFYFKDV